MVKYTVQLDEQAVYETSDVGALKNAVGGLISQILGLYMSGVEGFEELELSIYKGETERPFSLRACLETIEGVETLGLRTFTFLETLSTYTDVASRSAPFVMRGLLQDLEYTLKECG